MSLNNLRDLYVEELRDLYDADNQIIQNLPRFVDRANSQDLKDTLRQHVESTRRHRKSLEGIFSRLGMQPEGRECLGMQGLFREAQELVGQDGEPTVRDAAIIASMQRIEHYEMAACGGARTFASRLGQQEDQRQLQRILDEAKNEDQVLTRIATTEVNKEAVRS